MDVRVNGRSEARRFGRLASICRVAWCVGTLLSFARATRGADDVTVPFSLQAELIAKVAEYDRGFLRRAGKQAHILLAVKTDHVDSAHVASQLAAALSRLGPIAGLPHDQAVVSFSGAVELAADCRARRAAIVVFGPGFRNDLEALQKALTGVDVLSVSSLPDYVPKGIVLGFDLVSGRPKLLLNLAQAKLQGVDLTSGALKLMKVYE